MRLLVSPMAVIARILFLFVVLAVSLSSAVPLHTIGTHFLTDNNLRIVSLAAPVSAHNLELFIYVLIFPYRPKLILSKARQQPQSLSQFPPPLTLHYLMFYALSHLSCSWRFKF